MPKGTDSDEFRLVSSVRSGMKREFDFFVRNQTELSGSLGRTRGKKSPLISSPGNESPDLSSNKRFKSSDAKEVLEEKDEGLIYKGAKIDDGKPVGVEDLVKSPSSEVLEMGLEKSSVADEPEGDTVMHVTESVDEERIGCKTPMETFENSEVGKVVMVTSPRRVTRSSLKPKEEQMEMIQNDLQKPPTNEKLESNSDKLGSEDSKLDMLKSSAAEELKTAELEKSLNANGSTNGNPVIDGAKNINEEGICSEPPVVVDGNCEAQTIYAPMRRVTRSSLKPKVEPMEVSAGATSSGSSVLSEDACKNEETAKGITSDVVSQMKTPRKNKLEMKMSKKIAVAKFPSNARELLETGMLEGLKVNYVFRGNKKVGLSGTIKDRGVLCSCTACKGSNVVSLYEFEKHAGSSNKKPSEHIYLENGNSLREVLNACKDTPLDTLEATIKNFTGSSPFRAATTCQNCRVQTAKGGSPCSSCLESRKVEANTVCTVSNARLSKPVTTPKSSSSALAFVSPQNKSSKGKVTRKDLRLHKLVFEEDGLPDGTELGYYVRGKKLLEGYKKGFGILCRCCETVVSPSQFEAHAGWATRRKPYLNIYTSNGVSLHELSVSLSRGRKFSPNENDDLCNDCHQGGDLLLCDGCPRAFHQECAHLSSIPRGKWYCKCCLSMYQREKSCEYNANAKAAGRISGVDPIEQITKRCFRIVETLETEAGGCVLCRRHGFSKSGFGPQTVILCDQCEKEYHVGCLKDHNMEDLKQLPQGKWFCCADCDRIHNVLEKLIARGSEKLPDSILTILKRKQINVTELDVSWSLLSGQQASRESRSLLSKAVALFHDQFDPIVDSKTGRDFIPSMVYGQDMGYHDFGGMYCAVLTVNSHVVSAAILRIFGQEVAELPLVATDAEYKGQGYFQSLFCCIERLLGFLHVKNLVLPAAEEAKSIWTDKFGFKNMSQDELTEFRKKCQMMAFQGTSMLLKPGPKCRIVDKTTKDS